MYFKINLVNKDTKEILKLHTKKNSLLVEVTKASIIIIIVVMAYIISTLETSICGSKSSMKLICKSRRSRLLLMEVPISKVPFSWFFFSTLCITLKFSLNIIVKKMTGIITCNYYIQTLSINSYHKMAKEYRLVLTLSATVAG